MMKDEIRSRIGTICVVRGIENTPLYTYNEIIDSIHKAKEPEELLSFLEKFDLGNSREIKEYYEEAYESKVSEYEDNLEDKLGEKFDEGYSEGRDEAYSEYEGKFLETELEEYRTKGYNIGYEEARKSFKEKKEQEIKETLENEIQKARRKAFDLGYKEAVFRHTLPD